MEFTERQLRAVERLAGAGFRPMAMPPYERALVIRKGDCVALLEPVPNDGLQLVASPTILIEGNLSVKLQRGKDEVFVWKGKELEATPQRLQELEDFAKELAGILDETPKQ